MSFLDPVELAKLESLAIRARVIVEGALTGMHRARLRGSSVEFAEHKEYTPGDEIRHIDWKVFGKADRYYIKQYEQETQLTCHLVLDASGSMEYAGKGVLSKKAYASHLLAAIAYLLINQRDRVGISVFGGPEQRATIPPRSREAHLAAVLAQIEACNQAPSRGADVLSRSLEEIAERAQRRRGLVVVASDLFESGDKAVSVLKHLKARGHHTVVFHTLAPDELEFPFEGLTVFESLEGERELLADPAAIRKLYLQRMQAFLESTRKSCLQNGIDYHLARTSRPFESTLLDFLRGTQELPQKEVQWSS
jgi:uncharacterized protein (DUF58 family)